MAPKEKAKELFNKMFNVDDPMGSYPMCYETAKQCALIAVDEILDFVHPNCVDYILTVREEIEKL